jgi:type IV pilus assembly protein PilW
MRSATAHARRCPSRQSGIALVDTMVGLALALVATIVICQAFVVAEAARRNATGSADAQQDGNFALFALASAAANAGNGIAAAGHWLESCPATGDVATTQRPIVALITDGGAPDRPDALVVRQSFATVLAAPAAFAAAAASGASFYVQSPDGFAAGDRVVAIGRNGTCAAATITSVGMPADGVVEIMHTPMPFDLPANALLMNLGPAGRASTLRYDVVSATLRSTDMTNGDSPNPLASNIVNLKLQYGVDRDGDGVMDDWVSADAAGAWSPAVLLAAPRSTLDRIMALRIGVIARSDVFDQHLVRGYTWVLFDCGAADKAACPGRLEGTIPGSARGGYRYRSYEAVVPLRNSIWNRGA